MTKFKTIFALCIVVAIISTCILSASATISSNTSVYWGPKEAYAWAETVGSGPVSINFYVNAWIQSTSTYVRKVKTANSDGSGSAIATTDSVPVTYPSELPLVIYGGSHGY